MSWELSVALIAMVVNGAVIIYTAGTRKRDFQQIAQFTNAMMARMDRLEAQLRDVTIELRTGFSDVRTEMKFKFAEVDRRFDAVDKRLDSLEKQRV